MKKSNENKRRNHCNTRAQFLRDRSRMVHESAPLRDHPMWLHAVRMGRADTYTGPRFMVGKGTTFIAKRNEMKRKRRDLMVGISGSVRAFYRNYACGKNAAHITRRAA